MRDGGPTRPDLLEAAELASEATAKIIAHLNASSNTRAYDPTNEPIVVDIP